VRIVGLTPEPMANSEYRVTLPVRALAARGHAAEVIHWDFYRGADPPPFEHLRTADVVQIWRLHEPPVQRYAAALRDAGVAIVWDNDDDLLRNPEITALPKGITPAKELTGSELAAIMRIADVVTATCDELARRFRRLSGADVRVVENFLSGSFARRAEPRGGDQLVVGWVAGGEHRIDLKRLRLRLALERVLQRNPHVHLVSVGVNLGLRNERYHAIVSVPFAELSSAIAGFDVGIAPIADVSFNRVRSNVKVKEYAAVGVPWLASPIGPYRGMGERQGGRLVPDALWQRRVEELVGDDEARAALAQQAAEWGAGQTIERNVEQWESIFSDAVARACARSGRPVEASAPRGDDVDAPERRPATESSAPVARRREGWLSRLARR
jgi:glycosyltransferase involved in cell wall biosynthesis